MKKLKAKIKSVTAAEVIQKPSFLRVKCEECETVFCVPMNDITRGAYGCSMTNCPK